MSVSTNSFLDNTFMNKEDLLYQLEGLAEKLEILVRYESINIDGLSRNGGLCRIKGKYILILNAKTTVKEKIQILIKTLRQFDLSDMHIEPDIQELIEEGYEK